MWFWVPRIVWKVWSIFDWLAKIWDEYKTTTEYGDKWDDMWLSKIKREFTPWVFKFSKILEEQFWDNKKETKASNINYDLKWLNSLSNMNLKWLNSLSNMNLKWLNSLSNMNLKWLK
jgi:hypothetical protein